MPPEPNALSLRLAHTPGAQGDNILMGKNGVVRTSGDRRPALLVSYVYLQPFLEKQQHYAYRDWALDSGAFSAHNTGVTIVLEDYIRTCRDLLQNDPTLTDVFALDVIGDWMASLKNAEAMAQAGIPVIPTYHFGEPEHVLTTIARDYDKIALGGMKTLPKNLKVKWPLQCFARVWPKKIHGFAVGTKEGILSAPWHSVDATTWELGPCGFGRWHAYGRLPIKGSKQNLQVEIDYYLEIEREARDRFRKQMLELDGIGPTVRFAEITTARHKPWDTRPRKEATP